MPLGVSTGSRPLVLALPRFVFYAVGASWPQNRCTHFRPVLWPRRWAAHPREFKMVTHWVSIPSSEHSHAVRACGFGGYRSRTVPRRGCACDRNVGCRWRLFHCSLRSGSSRRPLWAWRLAFAGLCIWFRCAFGPERRCFLSSGRLIRRLGRGPLWALGLRLCGKRRLGCFHRLSGCVVASRDRKSVV